MSETFVNAHGRLVVASDTAEDLGEVKGFIVDPTATRIEAIHVSGRGRKAEVIPWSSIRSFGPEAVMAESADASDRISSDREAQAVKGKVEALGARVLSTAGFEIGTVKDVSFDPETGELTAIATAQGSIDVTRLRSLGSYALIVEAA